ncbi:maleylacetoacetate isomerase [Acinetobacter tandoii]|uniref:Maleylacetoacetate isomerase n=1 Tax=Acinetobacter tandoii DSM 14970 = CIP 107469 TaxID=1120927 RepID=R9B536_9GAMM|nr:maleylacetoacetate isomerase [Acinetobacter tandoii]EOR09370.1 maleylacetoacetate isomerase [Acinetobacter tandoii DSM 14970 = CIP 107469]
MKLYSYFRSSAAFRVRIALNLKGLSYDTQAVHLLKQGGEQHSAEYAAINPSELVPTLLDQQYVLTQSLSILEYLEEAYPKTALLPQNLQQRAQIRAFAQYIACEIHPLNNLRVLQYLEQTLAVSNSKKTAWYQHWIKLGFHSLEQQLQHSDGKYCFGEQASFADCCLIPQVYNAKRFQIDLTEYPKIQSIYTHCMQLAAFQQAAPEQQADWE